METSAIAISIVSIVIASGALIVSWLGIRAASKSINRMTLNYLFTTFNQANNVCFNNPDVFYAVDGLEKSVTPEEAIIIQHRLRFSPSSR